MSHAGTISEKQAFYQSMAAVGAATIAFIGVIHETEGYLILPWAPVILGPVLWNTLGISGILGGLILFMGTQHLIRVPVTLLAILTMIAGLGIGIWVAVLKHETHMFAYVLALAAAATAYFHRKAEAAG